jgi:aspartate oxidase
MGIVDQSFFLAHENAIDFGFDHAARPRVMPPALSPRILNIRKCWWVGIGVQEGIAAEGLAELEIVEHVRIELLVLAVEERRQVLGIIALQCSYANRICASRQTLLATGGAAALPYHRA